MISNVLIWTKYWATKTPVFCPKIIKLYSNGMDHVNVIFTKLALSRLDSKSKYRFYLRIFHDFIDLGPEMSHIAYTKLGNNTKLLKLKIIVAKALISRNSNQRDRSSLVGQTWKNFMNPPFPDKSQRTGLSFRRSKWHAVIARMKAQITNLLCPFRRVACTYAWLMRDTIFWSIICIFHQDYITYYIPFWENTILV